MKKEFSEIRINGINEKQRVERFIEEICDYYNISNEYFGNILLATTEATELLFTINASKDINIIVSFEKNKNGLIFKIKTENSRIRESIEEDILEREIKKHKLSKEIYIIKALADEVVISFKADRITLVFYISSINYEKSINRIKKLQEYWKIKPTVVQGK